MFFTFSKYLMQIQVIYRDVHVSTAAGFLLTIPQQTTLSKMTKDHMKSASSQSVTSMLNQTVASMFLGISSVQLEEFGRCDVSYLIGGDIVHFTEGLVFGCFWGSYGW